MSKKFIKEKQQFPILKKNEYVNRWIKNYSEKERQKRLKLLKDYSKFIEKTPTQLIQEHDIDRKQESIKITDIAKEQFLEYYKYLIGKQNKINNKMIKKPISINSARQYIFSKLAGFYKRNKIPLLFEKGQIPNETKGIREKNWYQNGIKIAFNEKKEILKQIRDTLPSIRDKTILICKIGSGLDDCDLFNLKVKDFKLGYEPDYKICYLEGYRQKKAIIYQTFFNSEACKLLETYLKERERKNEIITNDSWLFVANRENSKGKYPKIKDTQFSETLKKTCEILGIENVFPKQFRKFFNTILKRNKIDTEFVERMMGHKRQISAKYQSDFDDIDYLKLWYHENCNDILCIGNHTRELKLAKKKIERLESENLKHTTMINEISVKFAELMGKYENLDKRLTLAKIPKTLEQMQKDQ